MALTGRIRVPSDKSISHRAVLLASLAKGTSHLEDILASDDVRSTIAAMRALGAQIDLAEGPSGLSGTITGLDLKSEPSLEPRIIDCGNSGTTARLLLGVLAGLKVNATLCGDASLSTRPMERVLKPLQMMGAAVSSETGTLPVEVAPVDVLAAIDYETEQASAQVKSAILLAGMQTCGTTSVTEPSKSRDHTELLLPAFGVDVDVDGLTASVTGPSHLHAHDMRVPSDPSSAAFIAVAAALIEGSDVVMEGVALNKTRAGAFEVLKRMGADIAFESMRQEGEEPVGDVHVRYSPDLVATAVTPEEIPTLIDEIPILAIAAACAEGETAFEGAGELRVKESDRMAAIIEGLTALGFTAFANGDDLHVGVPCHPERSAEGAESKDLPSTSFRPSADALTTSFRAEACSAEVEKSRNECLATQHEISPLVPSAIGRNDVVALPTHHDHRLAMTWYLAGLIFDRSIELDDPDCVSISWPDFFDDLASLQS